MKIANVLAGFSSATPICSGAQWEKETGGDGGAEGQVHRRSGQERSLKTKAEKIFDLMEYFAGYGFNKSHSAAYALITYQTAYLKAHYANEFMSAILTSEMGNADKVVKYITECRNMGIQILPPDANESDRDFTVVPGIRFGLAAIKMSGAPQSM